MGGQRLWLFYKWVISYSMVSQINQVGLVCPGLASRCAGGSGGRRRLTRSQPDVLFVGLAGPHDSRGKIIIKTTDGYVDRA